MVCKLYFDKAAFKKEGNLSNSNLQKKKKEGRKKGLKEKQGIELHNQAAIRKLKINDHVPGKEESLSYCAIHNTQGGQARGHH